MKRRFDEYPLDLVLLGAAVLATAAFIALDWAFMRLLIGVPLVLILPGYSLVFLLFPERRIGDQEAAQGLQSEASGATTEEDLDRLDYQMRRQRGVLRGVERVAVSAGASLCLVGLSGIFLHLVGIGVFLVPYLSFLLLLSAMLAGFGIGRWYQLPRERRFALELQWSRSTLGASLPARVLSVLLILATVATAVTVLDELVDPDHPGRTRLYLLGPAGDMRCYPTAWEEGHYRPSLSASERECPDEVGDIFVGIINLEGRNTTYWLQVLWVQGFDQLNGTNPTMVHFVDEWTVTVAPQEPVEHFSEYEGGDERPFTVPPPPGNGTWQLHVQLFKQEPRPVELSGEYLLSAYRRAHLTIDVPIVP